MELLTAFCWLVAAFGNVYMSRLLSRDIRIAREVIEGAIAVKRSAEKELELLNPVRASRHAYVAASRSRRKRLLYRRPHRRQRDQRFMVKNVKNLE